MSGKALCIGINYTGTPFELRGCINDANDWGSFLHGQGFDVVSMLERQASRCNILTALRQVIDQTSPGTCSAVTYSGHGTWLPDLSGDEPDGRDEALCPADMGDNGRNLILDDELADLFGRLRPGARLLWISDCCHSGSVFRFATDSSVSERRVRFLPPSHFLSPDSPLWHGMERAFGQQVRWQDQPLPGVIHFSACRDHEYSADARIGGRFCGAMTYYALRAFRLVQSRGGTYQDVFRQLRQYLPSWDFQQTPQLNALPALRNTPLF
jgi:hypothetical protein